MRTLEAALGFCLTAPPCWSRKPALVLASGEASLCSDLQSAPAAPGGRVGLGLGGRIAVGLEAALLLAVGLGVTGLVGRRMPMYHVSAKALLSSTYVSNHFCPAGLS
jgi:hypothetical protein